MNISVKAGYALHALFDLATQPGPDPVKIGDIARRQRIPQKFLELILASLKQGGFVESRRGAEGGYLLARPAASITVGEVIRYVEGGRARAQDRPGDTPFSTLWQQVNSATDNILNQYSLADIRRSWDEKQASYVPNWDI
ncbi:MAG: Rrf2 family transcriptional regulator [Acidobacteria bacterium]|nr:Rrf2 family transcriptional regulator [Acidobacteriota bacterium]